MVMMQDDPFRLMTPTFVLYVFFDLFQQFTVVGTVHKASQKVQKTLVIGPCTHSRHSPMNFHTFAPFRNYKLDN